MPKRKHSDVAEAAGTSHDSDNEEELHFSDDEGTHVDGIYIPPPIKPVCSFDPKGPRLIITKIVNNFFKSYAKEIELGPFHKCFNAIVGPNGSGKSNVIDSMLFVFGYRATKIRSKKVSVLLHNSEQFRNVQSATVEVHFALIVDKEGDEYDIVPDSEFVVSRTANKDNSSFYQLNGRKVQFKEVAKLLRGHGIDLDHNRFLILQGEVEQIAMMKCKGENEHESGMLEYLEDIIGTTRYKKPLFLLDERVEALSGVRSEKINRLKLVENELEELKAPLEEAVGFLKAENTIIACKNVLIQKNIFDLEDQSKEVEEEKNVVTEEHKQLNENLKALTEEKSKNEAIIQKETAKYASLEKRKESLKEAFDKANNKDIKMQADMVQINTNRKKTKQLLAEERKKLEKLERQPEESRQGIAECEDKEKEHTAEKVKLEAEKAKMLLTLGDQTKELQEQKEVLETELVDLKKVVNEAKSAFTLAESELKLCLSNEETERTKFENIRSTFENSTRLFKERSTAVEQLKKKIPLTEKSIRGAQEELNIMRGEEQQVKSEIMKKRSSLEESRSAMQSSKSRNKVLDALTKQKQEGNCDGFFGRLGDLGAIDQKYDVAVSTACGPLDNIVVDTVTTAQWCIEFLKQYDIGRATFIALEKQEHLRQHANSKIRTPENVPRLFDLIRVQDERVKPAFYYALRDTLVANDLEQATKIAYGAQRFRVVTLKGDLIETTGTMSGGGKSVSRGRMGQSVAVCNVNPRDLETLEQEIDTFEKHFRDLREKQTTVERQLSALEPEFRQMKIDYEKYTIELQSLKQQLPLLSKQLEAQEAKAKSTKSDPQQVKKLSAVVEKKKIEFEKANETAGELQVKVDALTKEIKEKTIGKIKTMDKNISDVLKKIEKCKAEITRLTVAVKTAERNAKKAMEKVATMEQDIENAEKRLRQMKTEREEIESDAEKLMKCIEEVTEQLAEGEGEYADLKKIVEKLTKKETKLRSEKVDVDQKLKTVEKKFSDITAQMHQLNVRLSQLKLQDVPNETFEELKKFTKEEMDSKNIGTVEHDLKVAEHLLKSTKPNLSVIQEFRKKQDMYMSRAQELDEISTKRTEMKNLYEKLRNQRKDEFLVGFGIIRLKLKEMYQMITLGGDADFELVDTFDPFTEGIQFNVRPPKKSWKKIANLSGGEKTLSSLALVFALHYYKPSPLYVMDEIDAALDFKNVSIVGHYIKERTKNAQFIIISLRSNMFELCDNLIGIFKIHNCTQTITINPRIYEQESTKEDQVVPSNKDKDTVFDALKSSTSNKTAPASKNVAEGAEILEESMTVSEESIIPQSQEDQVIEDSFQSSEKMSDETIDQFFH